MQNMHNKDGMADNQRQQTYEGDANQIRGVPEGLAIQGQKMETLKDISGQDLTQVTQAGHT